MGQGKGKVLKASGVFPSTDWNMRCTPEMLTLDSRRCLSCAFSKTGLVDLSFDSKTSEYYITVRDLHTLNVVKQQSLSSMGVENLEETVKTPVAISVLRDTLVVVGTGTCGFVARWNPKQQSYVKPSLFRVNRDGFLKAVLFGEKPLLATITTDLVVKIWDTEKNNCLSTLTANKQESHSVAVSDTSGQLSIGGKEGLLLVYDSRNLGFQPKKMEIDKTGKFGISTMCHNTEGNKLALGLLVWTGPAPSLSSSTGSAANLHKLSSSTANKTTTSTTTTSSTTTPPLSSSLPSVSSSSSPLMVPIKIYNMNSYTLELEWKAHSKDITDIQWFAGILASCAKSEVPFCILLWSETNGEKLSSISFPSPIHTFRFDPLSRGFIAGSEEGLVTCKLSLLSQEEKTALAEEKEKREQEEKQLKIKQEEEEKLRVQKEEERKQKRREMQKGGVKFVSDDDEAEEEGATNEAEKEKEKETNDTSDNKSDNMT
eukprot:TRINITY_DN3654_c0_g1_i1.p1 TRINITY_DN3654_c0_g1~~TRINITY_DN3654_c0_g1_i1.p1  ORF type:complete len:485 (-),score=150.94 TRINITY_DN3654_c0_g1_i1:51-1505(-)